MIAGKITYSYFNDQNYMGDTPLIRAVFENQINVKTLASFI